MSKASAAQQMQIRTTELAVGAQPGGAVTDDTGHPILHRRTIGSAGMGERVFHDGFLPS